MTLHAEPWHLLVRLQAGDWTCDTHDSDGICRPRSWAYPWQVAPLLPKAARHGILNGGSLLRSQPSECFPHSV